MIKKNVLSQKVCVCRMMCPKGKEICGYLGGEKFLSVFFSLYNLSLHLVFFVLLFKFTLFCTNFYLFSLNRPNENYSLIGSPSCRRRLTIYTEIYFTNFFLNKIFHLITSI
jgi:hypothetical protein